MSQFPPNQLLRGSDLADVKLFKILNADGIHHGYQYKEGLNELIDETFNPSGDCESGGLYVTDRPEFWIEMGTKIAPVTLPPDAMVWTGSQYKFKVNKLILGRAKPIQYETYLAAVPYNKRVRLDGIYLQYVPMK